MREEEDDEKEEERPFSGCGCWRRRKTKMKMGALGRVIGCDDICYEKGRDAFSRAHDEYHEGSFF